MPDEGFTELAGDRVVLRRFHLGDVARFVAYRSDAQVARFQSWDAPYSLDEGERFVRAMMRGHPDTTGEWFQFAVALRPAAQSPISGPAGRSATANWNHSPVVSGCPRIIARTKRSPSSKE